jgi:hypothetical protein
MLLRHPELYGVRRKVARTSLVAIQVLVRPSASSSQPRSGLYRYTTPLNPFDGLGSHRSLGVGMHSSMMHFKSCKCRVR